MMTVTCRLSSGDESTGIRWVMGGLDPPIICTNSTKPVIIRPAGNAISYFLLMSKVMIQMLSAKRFMESKLPAIGTCPPAIHRRMNTVAKKRQSNDTQMVAIMRTGL